MKKPSRQLIDAFMNWFENNEHSNNEDKYSSVISQKHLSSLSKKDFIEFFYQFAKEGGMIQSGGQRTAGQFRETMERRYDEFHNFILEPFQEGFDEISWLQRIDKYNGFGQGLATIYLNRVDKKRFVILNNKAKEAMKLMDVDVPTAIVPCYTAVRDGHKQLMDWYPEFENYYRADAFTHFLIGEEIGKKLGAEFRGNGEQGNGGGSKIPDSVRYWIYAPGEQARHWDRYYEEGVMGIGWDPLKKDLSSFKSDEDLRKYYNQSYGDKATDQDFKQVSDFLFKVKKDDVIFVKRGISELVGYGYVDSNYYYDENRSEYRHLRKAKWSKKGQWAIPEDIKGLPVKTLTEVKDPTRVNSLRRIIGATIEQRGDDKGKLFSEKAFDLLNQLRNKPEASFYSEHSAEFSREVEEPLQELLKTVATKLPKQMADVLETEKRIFSRIIKNDYGRGGAWEFYWGAFYPKGGKRTLGPQLYVFISSNGLRFGFSIGEYGVAQRKRFEKNCSDHSEELVRVVKPSLANLGLKYGLRAADTDNHLSVKETSDLTFEQWIAAPEQYGYQASVELQPEVVTHSGRTDLIDHVTEGLLRLYPLFLVAHYDEPMEPMRLYLGAELTDPKETNVEYPITQFAEEAFITEDQIEHWVRAIRHKRQIIFYGPPGTGKTFIAKKLARHLIGGGDGISEIIQFHPSYAYEDFIQGLRPRALKGGLLEYAMVPGRFKDFCSQAQECEKTCVLIVDEINRANLSRVFGELMYLLEYREEAVPLAGGERFQIPENVYLIGTMNTADRSIALVDHALRRRFAFLSLYPDYDILKKYHAESDFEPTGLISVLERINIAINDKHYSVGTSYFLLEDIKSKISDIWQMEIEPYIEELFFDQPQKAASFAWTRISEEIL